jgi:hypothetical protein
MAPPDGRSVNLAALRVLILRCSGQGWRVGGLQHLHANAQRLCTSGTYPINSPGWGVSPIFAKLGRFSCSPLLKAICINLF